MTSLRDQINRLKAQRRQSPQRLAAVPTVAPPTVRHLIYHVYAAKSNDLWQRNVDQLLRRWDLFNGRRIIAIASDRKTHPAKIVQAEFPEAAEILETKNDPDLREVATFGQLLKTIANPNPEEATFYAHTKGNTTASGTKGATRWRNAMYAHLLDRWPDVATALRTAAAVGTTQMIGQFRYPTGLQFGPGFWMFAGTFFWIRHDAIFGLPNWQTIPQDRYGAEAWLGTLVNANQVHSIFQPWPPRRFPDASPYHPKYYPQKFDD